LALILIGVGFGVVAAAKMDPEMELQLIQRKQL